MTKLPEKEERTFPPFLNNRKSDLFDIDLYSPVRPHSLAEVRDNLRLKSFLKRAVEKDFASDALINSIRTGIRR